MCRVSRLVVIYRLEGSREREGKQKDKTVSLQLVGDCFRLRLQFSPTTFPVLLLVVRRGKGGKVRLTI